MKKTYLQNISNEIFIQSKRVCVKPLKSRLEAIQKLQKFQEGIMSEAFQRPDKSFFQKAKELSDLINKENLIHRYLPKQTDIDKMLEFIQRKVFIYQLK